MATLASPVSHKTRNVIVVGKTGSGKSTVANKILGNDEFEVTMAPSSATSEPDLHSNNFEHEGVQYTFNVIDTIGLFDTRKINNKEVMQKTKDAIKSRVEGLHLIVFVIKETRLTSDEKKVFEIIHKNFSKDIDPLSLLVITGCEGKSKDDVRAVYATNSETKDILCHMKKGVLPVGFPDIDTVRESFKGPYREQIAEDSSELRKRICECDTMYLSEELYSRRWCIIL